MDRQLLRMLRDAKRGRNRLIKVWKSQAQLGPGQRIQCRGIGCVGCCYQLVLAHIWEGALIARYLMETDQQDAILMALQAAHRAGEFIGNDYTPQAVKAAAEPYMDARIRCVFLAESGACQIYGLRPLACASYYVVSDPETCYLKGAVEVGVLNNQRIMDWGFDVEKWILEYLVGPGQAPFVIPMPIGAAISMGVRVLTDGAAALDRLKTMET